MVAHQRGCDHYGLTSLESLNEQVRHARDCPQHPKSKDKEPDCTCGAQPTTCSCTKPSYYTFYTGRDEKPVRGKRVRNRRVADTALRKLQVELDENRVGVAQAKSSTFNEWVPIWRERADDGSRSPETIDQSETTARLAAETFGNHDLREITDDEIHEFVKACRRRGNRPRTVDKHLRHLHGIFQFAIGARRLEQNPIDIFRRTFSQELPDAQPNYFTDTELALLWRQLQIGIPHKDGITAVPIVYLYLCKFAVTTGARLGELAALTWANVDPDAGEYGEIKITGSSHQKYGVGKTKTRSSRRTVHLIPDARRVLDAWMPVLRDLRGHGAIDDNALVFPAPMGGRIQQTNVANRMINPIMAAAGVPKTTDETPEERSFHTFRHTYARLMLQPRKDADGNTVPGESLQWVRDELGHSSITITEKIYGHWSKQAKQDVAAGVPSGVVPV
jgi:integrase